MQFSVICEMKSIWFSFSNSATILSIMSSTGFRSIADKVNGLLLLYLFGSQNLSRFFAL